MHMSGGRLPKRTVSGNIGVQGGEDRVGRKKRVQWTDVQSEFRAFGITGDWEVTALEARVWVETVTDGRRRFIAAWGREEVQYSTIDAARHHNEKKQRNETGKINVLRRRVKPAKRHQFISCTNRKNPLVRAPDEPKHEYRLGTKTRYVMSFWSCFLKIFVVRALCVILLRLRQKGAHLKNVRTIYNKHSMISHCSPFWRKNTGEYPPVSIQLNKCPFLAVEITPFWRF